MDTFTPSAKAPEPGLVAASVYAQGRRLRDIAIEEAGAWAGKDGSIVWIGLCEPSIGLLRRVQAQLHLHELAIEDAGKAHQYPKVEQYGDALFVVARTAQVIDGKIAFGETHIFVGKGYVVSVRHGPSSSYRAVREQVEILPGQPGARRGLHPLFDPRLHRRQLRASGRVRAGRGRRAGGRRAPQDAVRCRSRSSLQLAARAAAIAQGGDAAGRCLPAPRACRRGIGRAADASILPRRQRPYPSRPGRHRIPCARSWPSPSRRA